MANSLNFLKGTRNNFDAIAEKVATSFYVVEDIDSVLNGEETMEVTRYSLYLGSTLIADGVSKAIVDALEVRIASLEGLVGNDSVADQIAAEIKTIKEAYEAADKTLQDNIAAIKVEKLTAEKIAELNDANVYEAYELVGANGKLGETIKIYKDSALKKVELVDSQPVENEDPIEGQFLKFEYKLADGSDSIVYLNVSDFLVESEFGNGLIVSDAGVVSVKLAAATAKNTDALVASGKNFLEMEDGALAVRSVDTDSTVLQKDLKIAGLSGQFGAGNYSNNQVIPAGTDIYTILQNILCKELYPSGVTYSTANISSSIGAPTINLTKTGTQIYGTSVSVSSVTCAAVSVKTTDNTVSNLTYGYSSTDDDVADSTETTISKSVTSSITDATYDLSLTFVGFNGQTEITATGESSSACKISNASIGYVTMGNNIITAAETGPVVKGVADAIPSGYTVSNLGNTDSTKTYSGKTKLDKTLPRPANTAATTVVGVLPCYCNVSGETFLEDVTKQMSLITGKTFTLTVPSEVAAKKHFMFDFPADRTVSSFKVKDLQGNFVAFEAAYSQQQFDNDGKEIFIEKTINGFTMKYRRLQTTGSYVGDGEYEITLSTNLNTATMDSVIKK